MPTKPRPVIHAAQNRDQLEQALHLVHDVYVRAGHMLPHPSGIRIGPHHLLPQSRTFVAALEGEVVATLGLFPDSPCKLPLDCAFAQETDRLRINGKRLAEIGMFADRRSEIKRSLPVLLDLMLAAFVHSRHLDLDALLVAVSARHSRVYCNSFGFSRLAGPTVHPHGNGLEVNLLQLDLRSVRPDDLPERLGEHFRKARNQTPAPDSYAMDLPGAKYFLQARPEILQELPMPLEQLYPAPRPAGKQTGQSTQEAPDEDPPFPAG